MMDDEDMKACANVCRACARSCREMSRMSGKQRDQSEAIRPTPPI
jgi:hypothetical protein